MTHSAFALSVYTVSSLGSQQFRFFFVCLFVCLRIAVRRNSKLYKQNYCLKNRNFSIYLKMGEIFCSVKSSLDLIGK
jgi:hypothetical protein